MEPIPSSITSHKLGLFRRFCTDTFIAGHNQMTCRVGHVQPLFNIPHLSNRAKISRVRTTCDKKGDSGSEYGLVDENMIVLRKRIHELEVAEHNYDVPSHWMEWEKGYYAMYGSDVCEFVGLIQRLLLKARPGLGIGLVVLTAMSVPTSAVFICLHLVVAVRLGVLGG